VLLGIIAYFLSVITMKLHSIINNEIIMIISIFGVYLLYFFLFFFLKAIFEQYVKNYIWSVTTLSESKFSSRLEVSDLTKIYMINILAVVFSLGLLTPWAKIRLLKYRTSQFFVETDELDNFIAGESVDESAIGDAGEDFFDFDIGV